MLNFWQKFLKSFTHQCIRANQEKQFEADGREQPTAKATTETSQAVKNGNVSFVEMRYNGQVVSDSFDLTNPMFRGECRNFLSEIEISNLV